MDHMSRYGGEIPQQGQAYSQYGGYGMPPMSMMGMPPSMGYNVSCAASRYSPRAALMSAIPARGIQPIRSAASYDGCSNGLPARNDDVSSWIASRRTRVTAPRYERQAITRPTSFSRDYAGSRRNEPKSQYGQFWELLRSATAELCPVGRYARHAGYAGYARHALEP